MVCLCDPMIGMRGGGARLIPINSNKEAVYPSGVQHINTPLKGFLLRLPPSPTPTTISSFSLDYNKRDCVGVVWSISMYTIKSEAVHVDDYYDL